ncbi:MAG TPA: VOC family protein [Stellaceae bacterium]|nr:VOC family protein [Stellaceae bacterium]
MTQPSAMVLYVEDVERSGAFYGKLFGLEPVAASPNFRAFEFPSGLRLGMWARRMAEPMAIMTGGGAEIVLPVASYDEVDATHQDWRGRGLNIVQRPTTMDFGRTFLAIDPDGHRLRVFAERTH